MRRFLIYSIYLVGTALLVWAFLICRTYSQLGSVILIYPLLAYLGYKIFVEKSPFQNSTVIKAPPPQGITELSKQNVYGGTNNTESVETSEKDIGIADINRRAFLKIIGATGLSVFIFSLLGRRVEPFLFNQPFDPRIPSGDINESTPTLPIDEYTISDTDDSEIGYYGFTKPDGSWFIMVADTNLGSFRYSKGISNFTENWKKRTSLKYDYFHNVF